MTRNQFVLACLSTGIATQFSPVQLQKLFFLIDRNIATQVDGPYFSFEPYMYGPFDKDVYSELEDLVDNGMLQKRSMGKWNEYVITEKGQGLGKAILSHFPGEVQLYIKNATRLVTTLSFRELVSAIYKAYPEMKKNSVFLP